MSLLEIFNIIIIHWFADFVLQSDWQAKNKSKNWNALLAHTGSYSFVWLGIMIFLTVTGPFLDMNNRLIYFPFITMFFHTLTDYFTSRLNSKLWAKGDVHNFFVSIGFDQVLHYIQLFLTYSLLK